MVDPNYSIVAMLLIFTFGNILLWPQSIFFNMLWSVWSVGKEWIRKKENRNSENCYTEGLPL